MNTTVVCRDVHRATENSNLWLIIASQDGQEVVRAVDLMAASNLTEVRDRLHAQGVVLGQPLQPAPTPTAPSSLAPPVRIITHDDDGNERQWLADRLEEYSLSSGSTLYYLYVPEAPCDCRWLVGRTLELAEITSGVADRILQALKSRPDGMGWEEIRRMFDKSHSDEQIRQALLSLMKTPLPRSRQKVEKRGEDAGERFLLAAS